MIEINKIYLGDCIDIMKSIDNESIDMILCDLPYGKTKSNFDIIIPIKDLWTEYKRIIKKNSAVVLTAIQPFSSMLVSTNYEMFKYEWIWNKKKPSNFLLSKVMPMMITETVLVFGYGKLKYNPQMTKGKLRDKSSNNSEKFKKIGHNGWGKVNFQQNDNINDDYYPKNIIEISNANQRNKLHPTQKPIELFEYLIKTYTNEGDIVLDNCIGSGTTAITCNNLKRNFIGIEKDETYYNICLKRIDDNSNVFFS